MFIGKFVLAVGGVSLFMVASAAAQEQIGKQEFDQRCAVCHGADGRGDGPMAESFTTMPANLTVLSKNNGGVYPFSKVYEAIDGRRNIAAHGTSQMPLWGRYFMDTTRREGMQDPTPLEEQESKIVQGRILSLVYYLYTLQAE
jgi:mono/diheme cytochrome c family protein